MSNATATTIIDPALLSEQLTGKQLQDLDGKKIGRIVAAAASEEGCAITILLEDGTHCVARVL